MEELDLKELLQMFWNRKIQIIIIVIISMIIGGIYTMNCVTPAYKSSTTLILGRINASEDNKTTITDENKQITQSEISINSSLVSTYSELIKSKALIKEVKENLNTDLPETELRKSISVSRVSDTELIEITVTNIDANIASLVANEIAKVFGNKIEEIYKISNVYIIDEAIPATNPYNINHVKDIVLFSAVGLIISIAYTILYGLLDTTVKTSSDMEKSTNIKNLISIPYNKNEKSELITYEDSKSVVSEAFKTLRTNVQFSSISDKKTKTYLVTSCFQSEGKSYIAANLAVTFAQTGKKVILIDSDMRRGRQAKVFNFPNECGLSNYISNIDPNGMEINYDITQFIKETGINNLNIITSGNIPPNPSELLESARVSDLIKELKEYYDVIIFDGAPVLPITDSLILARLLDSTLIVARYNKTKKDDLAKAKSDIENVGGKIIGTCLNAVELKNGSNDSNYYYYYYGMETEENVKQRIKKRFKNISTAVSKLKKLPKVNKSKKIRIIDEVQAPKKPVVKDVKRENIDIVNTVIKEANKNNYYEESILKDQEELKIKQEMIEEAKIQDELRILEEQRKIDEARKQEQLRKREEQRKIEEARKQEELRKAEEQRKIEEARKQEALRKAEEQRKIEEARKQEELRKAEEQRKIEEARKQEELRKAEEQRKMEEARKQEELRKLEEQRKIEEARRQEELRKAEEKRKKKEAREQKIKDTIDGIKNRATNVKERIEKEKEERRIRKAEKKIKAMEEQAKQVKEKLQKAEEERNKMFGKRIMFEIDGDEVDEIIDLSDKNRIESKSAILNEYEDSKKLESIKNSVNKENEIDDELYPRIK